MNSPILRELVDEVVEQLRLSTDDEYASTEELALLLETATVLAEKALAEQLIGRLTVVSDRTTRRWTVPTSIARLLAAASSMLGGLDQAKAYYQQSIGLSRRMRFRPELALSRLGLAELLLDHYPDEHADAIEHLDFAINEFRDMKMQPSLERALGRKQVLGA